MKKFLIEMSAEEISSLWFWFPKSKPNEFDLTAEPSLGCSPVPPLVSSSLTTRGNLMPLALAPNGLF
jgi:hypothetical protein